ncbi:hypothetical protein LIA77_06415 [Sarocladium implicatum]|nr:hypothetical protein LIA77_06415 [Sarocladium implicatum]
MAFSGGDSVCPKLGSAMHGAMRKSEAVRVCLEKHGCAGILLDKHIGLCEDIKGAIGSNRRKQGGVSSLVELGMKS